MLSKIIDVSVSIDQPRTLSDVMHKTAEEYGELATAYTKDRAGFIEEAADVIIVVTDAVQKYVEETYGSESGIASNVLLEDAIRIKLEKWKTVYGNKA